MSTREYGVWSMEYGVWRRGLGIGYNVLGVTWRMSEFSSSSSSRFVSASVSVALSRHEATEALKITAMRDTWCQWWWWWWWWWLLLLLLVAAAMMVGCRGRGGNPHATSGERVVSTCWPPGCWHGGLHGEERNPPPGPGATGRGGAVTSLQAAVDR